MSDRLCSVNGCENAYHCRGVCKTHYHRLWKYGDVNTNSKNGRSKHHLYRAWAGMVNRCHNPNNTSFHQYGARGIVVTQRWREFRNFLADMGERPEGMTLDRIDPNGPYAPWNCRWATHTEQRVNRSADGEARQRAGARAGANRRWADPEARQAASEATRKQWIKRKANPIEF